MEPDRSERANPASAEEMAAVHRITLEVFGIEPIFKVQEYVECEGTYMVVEVPAIGPVEEISKRSSAWHRKMAEHKPVLSSFALSLQFA